jgi:hypothetical protein
VPSRERRRAERRKRKERGARAAAERMRSGYSKAEERNREAREALEPLKKGERPRVVTVAAILSAFVAVGTMIAWIAGAEVDGDRPELVQAAAPALLIGIMAWGMWKARYWAVLGFQALLVFLMFSAAFGLGAQAGSVWQILATLALLAVAATLFYLMIKAMARIQMPSRLPRD